MLENETNKEETIIQIMTKVSKWYEVNFYTSVDGAFNNCIHDCRNLIFQKAPNDFEMFNIFNGLVTYLTKDISSYALSKFSEDNLKNLLSSIKEDNKKQFDEKFMLYAKRNKEKNIWMSAVEERLYELLTKQGK